MKICSVGKPVMDGVVFKERCATSEFETQGISNTAKIFAHALYSWTSLFDRPYLMFLSEMPELDSQGLANIVRFSYSLNHMNVLSYDAVQVQSSPTNRAIQSTLSITVTTRLLLTMDLSDQARLHSTAAEATRWISESGLSCRCAASVSHSCGAQSPILIWPRCGLQSTSRNALKTRPRSRSGVGQRG